MQRVKWQTSVSFYMGISTWYMISQRERDKEREKERKKEGYESPKENSKRKPQSFIM